MSLPRQLDQAELRVLGALIEKSLTTPDQYPLTVNALRNACNQKSSRDPVMTLTERDVQQALRALESMQLVRESMSSGRAIRWEQRARERLELSPSELAVICLLALRGAQTPGEIRSRSGRLFNFVDRSDVERTIERLSRREPPLVARLSRAAGQKEQRYAQLLGDTPVVAATAVAAASPATDRSDNDGPATMHRLDELEQRLSALEEWVASQDRDHPGRD